MSNSSQIASNTEEREPKSRDNGSSSGNCESSDERSQTSGSSEEIDSGYEGSEQKNGKKRKPLARTRKEFRLQRRDSRNENEMATRTRAGSTYSKVSRSSSKYSMRSIKRKKRSSKFKEEEEDDAVSQDQALPEEDIKLDENGNFTGYKGKIMEYSPGNQYGRFNILLGEGAYKKVYLAYDTKNGFEVAWNTIKMKSMKSSQMMRIVNEMKILHTLRHESILKFYTSWMDSSTNTLIFITEAMHSGTLSEFIKARPVRLRILRRWCRHILNALIYLHEEHTPAIIHRDLKLDNIFVNGSSGEIRIGDLGLASWERCGNAKSVLGTPEYMAPEMYQESYDEKVDIYAFGLCVLEMISKQIPYRECVSAPQIYRKVMAGEPPESFTKVKECQLKEFIRLCISPSEDKKTEENPSGRPSASELLNHPFLAKNEENEKDDDKVSEDFFEGETESELSERKSILLSQTSKMSKARSSIKPPPRPKLKRAVSDISQNNILRNQSSMSSTPREISKSSETESLHSLASKASEYTKVLTKMAETQGTDEKGLETISKLESSTNEAVSKKPSVILREEDKIDAEEEYHKAEGILKEVDQEGQKVREEDNIDAEEEYHKAEGILKEVEQEEDGEKVQKQVEFGTKEVMVIDTEAPPVDVSTDSDKTIKLPEEAADPEKEDDYFRWMIQATSNQQEYEVSEDGKLMFEPIIKIDCQTDEAAGDFNFDTSSAKDSGLTRLISQALNLEESEYSQLLENIKSIRRQYESFKKRLQKSYDQGKTVEKKSFKYGTFNSKKKPEQVEAAPATETAAKPSSSTLIDDIIPPKPKEIPLVSPIIPVEEKLTIIEPKPNVVVPLKAEETAKPPPSPKTVEKEELSNFVDLLIGKGDTKDEVIPKELERSMSPLNLTEVDQPSVFPFINESNENLDRAEAIVALKKLRSQLDVCIPAFQTQTKPGSKVVLNATKAFLDFLNEHVPTIPTTTTLPKLEATSSPDIRIGISDDLLRTVSSTQSMPLPSSAMHVQTSDINLVENLVMQLSTPPPDPNELKTLDPPAKVLRKHSTADLSQNSDNSTSVHTAVNSTNSLLEDPFKQLEGLSNENTITPEKQTNFDSLFPSSAK